MGCVFSRKTCLFLSVNKEPLRVPLPQSPLIQWTIGNDILSFTPPVNIQLNIEQEVVFVIVDEKITPELYNY